MSYKKKGEVYPLLTTDWLGTPTYRQKPQAIHVRQDEGEEVPIIDDEDEVFDIIDQKKKRSVNLVWMDVALLVLDFLQIFALIQSMSLRWVFPERWLRHTYYVFAVNLDAWEMLKFSDENTYDSIQDYYIPSSSIGTSYQNIMYGWFIGTAGLTLLYAALHFSMKFVLYPESWARRLMSWVQMACMVIIHVLSLPLGIALFRVFTCEGEYSKMYTMNEYDCFTSNYWKNCAPAIIYILVAFLIYPGFLVWKTRLEGMTGTDNGYLSFILIKETEYKIHLNRAWLNDSVWIFSSFKHRGRYYRTALQLVKLVLLIIFAAAFNYIKLQALLTCILLLLVVVAAIVTRPFRLTSLNAFLVFSLLCNVANTFLGALLTNYTPATTPSAWLTPSYVFYFLVMIQGFWLLSLFALLVYLISRTFCHSTKSCYKRSVWPNIATSGAGQLTPETRKFMTGIIKAKIAHEKIQRLPAMFAPVHDLARHIQIMNTYCREAEYLGDPLHMVLWEVLDDLVETHANISPKSLFAESVKKSIRRTAAEFMPMVPMFSQRLAQRDYDFILVPPHKKRILLKMYIMGLFLNGRAEKLAKKKLLEPELEKMWPSLPADKEFEEEDGYYEDLYPQAIGGNYSDDLLDVINEDSTDAESTEEEDNVQGMLRNLPDVGLIDLEVPTVEVPDDTDSEEENFDQSLPKVKFGLVTSSDRQTPRPVSASSKSSKSSSSSSSSSNSSKSGSKRPSSAGSSLFGSVASLRRDHTGFVSPSRALSPQGRPASGQSGRSLSPTSSALRPASAGSNRSGRDRSPTGTSVVGSQPSLRDSQELGDNDMANINPGYVPDPEEENERKKAEFKPEEGGDNSGFIADDESMSVVTATTDSSKGPKSAQSKKSGKDNKSGPKVAKKKPNKK
ncbi:uncharacterized protein LOC132743356 [Ruditapes philippinarum]|uniref:uncharacterized protein LOC132743356 n=1 Tax=Ruditapes philippinarum TaxID=129788 RepID=UPI00295B264B|nr:uncharacterized protein LOC132743356 [Ruditapes philippinarum]XP_060587859.1 uncharacterized protein LOC132743356 [Ruditapes philippinarum]